MFLNTIYFLSGKHIIGKRMPNRTVILRYDNLWTSNIFGHRSGSRAAPVVYPPTAYTGCTIDVSPALEAIVESCGFSRRPAGSIAFDSRRFEEHKWFRKNSKRFCCCELCKNRRRQFRRDLFDWKPSLTSWFSIIIFLVNKKTVRFVAGASEQKKCIPWLLSREQKRLFFSAKVKKGRLPLQPLPCLVFDRLNVRRLVFEALCE